MNVWTETSYQCAVAADSIDLLVNSESAFDDHKKKIAARKKMDHVHYNKLSEWL